MRNPSVIIGLLLATLAISTLKAQTLPPSSVHKNGQQSITNESHSGINTQKFSDGSEVSSDLSGKPAVLCMWQLDIAMLALSRQCDSSDDKEFQQELESPVSTINRFIVLNSHRRPVTQSQIEAQASAKVAKFQTPDICRSDLPAIYRTLKDRGAAALRASTADMLSVPREPVINPCF